MSAKQKITTFLWFDSNAEEAMNHYVSQMTKIDIAELQRAHRDQ